MSTVSPFRLPRTAPPVATLALVLALAATAPTATAASTTAPHPVRCTVNGTKGNDVLRGTDRHDVICGRGGDDRIDGRGGDDLIDGGAGNDVIRGGAGDDALYGNSGSDRLMGGRGKDSLYGESGDDRLAGDGSADAIYGGVGDDTLDGGAGADQVVGGPGHNLGGPAPNGIPACPSTREACSVSIHVDMKLYCPSYRFALAACLGTTPYANLGWDVYLSDLPAMWAQFSWTGSRNRNVSMTAVNGVPTGRIDGSAPDSSSAAFSVQNAWTLKWPNPSIRWYTPDRPGVAPGQVGGPLYLNFRNGIVGADAYIDGYLFRR